ncbi:MAG TPA: esterase [Casimicrobiaceae bacterium]|nr:esterase [Casimicrobiaceae bacterium]
MNLDATLHLLPREGPASPLYLYLHDAGATALAMTPIADRFAQIYPHAAHLIPDGFEASDLVAEGREWFSTRAIVRSSLQSRVAVALEPLVAFIREAQVEFDVTPLATALVGFAQGGMLALEAAQAHAGLVGRVVAIGSRYATLPTSTPDAVIHLVNGKDDDVIAPRHAIEAATRLIALGGDVTADIVPGIGHEAHPELVERALGHLQTFLPRRIWAQALAEAPLMATRADSRSLARPVAPLAANDPT